MQRLAFPNLRQGSDEDFRRAVDLPGTADSARDSGGKQRNTFGEARCLGSADLTSDQSLACSDQNWHSGSLAPQTVERQTKGEYVVYMFGVGLNPSCVRSATYLLGKTVKPLILGCFDGI